MLLSRILSLITYVVALFSPFAAAHARSDNEAQIRGYISGAASNYFPAGFTTSHGPFYGTANPSETVSFELQLIGGYRYVFVGQCDSDCRDIDMSILNSSGGVIARDTLSDDDPLVAIDAGYDMTVVVSMRMFNCSTNWCGWGLVVGSNYGGLIS